MEAIDDANSDLEAAQDEAMEALADVELPELPDLPKPTIRAKVPEALFDSTEDYETASLRLKRHKELYPEEDDEGSDA